MNEFISISSNQKANNTFMTIGNHENAIVTNANVNLEVKNAITKVINKFPFKGHLMSLSLASTYNIT